MKKGIYLLLLLVVCFLSSCSDNGTKIDWTWKEYNDNLYTEAKNSGKYNVEWTSYSGNGKVLAKVTDRFDTDVSERSIETKITKGGYPTMGDSILVRYEGWYYYDDSNGKRQHLIFDSTEGRYNKQDGVGFRIGGSIIDGWNTALQNMKEGESYQIVLPQELGYLSSGSTNSSGQTTIPGFTTLWFDIKILKVVPLNPDEYK